MKTGEGRKETFGKRRTGREGERERDAREEYCIQIVAAIAVRVAPPLLYARHDRTDGKWRIAGDAAMTTMARTVLFRTSVGVSARRIAQCGLGLGACNGAVCQSGRQLHEEKPEEKRRELRWRYKGGCMATEKGGLSPGRGTQRIYRENKEKKYYHKCRSSSASTIPT
jgi:hypothetical protein